MQSVHTPGRSITTWPANDYCRYTCESGQNGTMCWAGVSYPTGNRFADSIAQDFSKTFTLHAINPIINQSHQWFRKWLVAKQVTSHYLNHWWLWFRFGLSLLDLWYAPVQCEAITWTNDKNWKYPLNMWLKYLQQNWRHDEKHLQYNQINADRTCTWWTSRQMILRFF